ncbi:MAG: hypothetical protein KatS3mg081_1496 [Gemmatimonadales bacterium]|nr:MAG: hypothetical protein KatS3mg081_1496 [Gemmatimonadales bacterium]
MVPSLNLRGVRSVPVLALVLWLVRVPGAEAQNDVSLPLARSVLDSVYSAAQAQRGETAFRQTCTECHTPSQFSGPNFITAWRGAPLYQLFDLIRTTMPNDFPGSLPAQTYADIVAYILKLNQYPAGQKELAPDPDSLKAIRIEPPRSP